MVSIFEKLLYQVKILYKKIELLKGFKKYDNALQTLEFVNNIDEKIEQNVTNYKKLKKELSELLHIEKYVIKHHHLTNPY